MKFRRFLSGLLFGIGCALAFAGLLALLLPMISNQQLKLVLNSFSMPSDNGAVTLMNRAMSFALANSWRVLSLGAIIAAVGAWLLVHFTPVQRPAPCKPVQPPAAPPPESMPQPEPEPVFTPAPEPVNPFAAAAYSDHLPARPRGAAKTFVVHAAPMLEKNRIEESNPLPAEPLQPAEAEAQPYRYARFSAEARAIETEADAPSQSGSRALFRNAPEPIAAKEPPVIETPAVADAPSPLPEPAPKAAAPSAPLSTPAPMAPFSPRIRSTMGQRSAARRNLPASRP